MTRTVLLVIDVQRVYMEPDPMVTSDGDDLLVKCGSLIAQAREAGASVIFVQHVSDEQPDDPELVRIHPDIAPAPGETIVQKQFGSAFMRTVLEQTLVELETETLYICGLETFGCVNATVMCAICQDYDVVVVKDAHGAQALGPSTAHEVIDVFNRTWERAGARLMRANEITF
jgi:nicotinamidase-related amidase